MLDDDYEEMPADASPDQSAAPVPPVAAPLNPVLAKYLQGKQDMQDAQAKASQNQLIAGLARAGATAGHALSRASAPMDSSGFDSLDKSASLPVDQITAQQSGEAKELQNQQALLGAEKSQQSDDPDSPQSVASRSVYGTILKGAGLDPSIIESMSAADIDSYIKAPLEQKEKLNERMQERQLQADSRNEMASNKRSDKTSDTQNKAYKTLVDSADNFRGNAAAGQANKNLLAADNALSMVNGRDLDSLSQQQVQLFTDELAKIATGGVPSEGGTQALMPSNLSTQIAKMQNYLTSNPSPSKAGAYIRDNIAYLNELRANSQGMVDTYRRNKAMGSRALVSPDQLSEYNDRYNLNAKPSTQTNASPNGSPPAAASKPKTVTQNGHTYTLNDQTGEYE